MKASSGRNQHFIISQKPFQYKLGGYDRDDWDEEFISPKCGRGNQAGVFDIIPGAANGIPTLENVFASIPANKAYRPPRIMPIPRLSGMMTANVESGAGDE
jgi:hypothetical protein